MIFLVLGLSAIMVFGYIGYISFMSNAVADLSRDHEFINPANRQFISAPGSYSSSGGYENAQAVSFNQRRENIEAALIRTCRTISTRAHASGCTNWNTSSVVWGFAGVVGGVSTIDTISTGASSVALAPGCTNMAEYGRNIFKNQITNEAYVGAGYLVNLTGLDDTFVDVCGYDNLVTR